MSELKILIHIGHHLNVVNLLGACTKAGGEKSSVNKQQRNTLQLQWCLDVSVVESDSHAHPVNTSMNISTPMLIGELLLLQNMAPSHQWVWSIFFQWCHFSVFLFSVLCKLAHKMDYGLKVGSILNGSLVPNSSKSGTKDRFKGSSPSSLQPYQEDAPGWAHTYFRPPPSPSTSLLLGRRRRFLCSRQETWSRPKLTAATARAAKGLSWHHWLYIIQRICCKVQN